MCSYTVFILFVQVLKSLKVLNLILKTLQILLTDRQILDFTNPVILSMVKERQLTGYFANYMLNNCLSLSSLYPDGPWRNYESLY